MIARMTDRQKHVFSVLLANESGVLSRVAGLFSARGYNIQSLTVAPTVDSSLSRMTIVTVGEDQLAEQVVKQLNKLVDVIEILDLAKEKHLDREMLLAKIVHDNSEQSKNRIFELAKRHGAEVIECLDTVCLIQMMAIGTQIDAFIEVARKEQSILEVVRSGVITLSRSDRILGEKK